MTVLVHISDLHVGFAEFREDILLNTITYINELNPDAVIISGDLTDHGYYNEFVKAKEFVSLIIPPTLIVPGNHDARNLGDEIFEEVIGHSHNVLELNESQIKIIGLNSSEPDLDHGKIGRLQKKYMEEQIDDAKEKGYYTVITFHHHIISIPNTGRERNVLSDAGDILYTLINKDVNLVLSGHKHVPHVWKMNNTLIATTGTVSSMKLRGKSHPSFNVIEISDDNKNVKITLNTYDGKLEEKILYDDTE